MDERYLPDEIRQRPRRLPAWWSSKRGLLAVCYGLAAIGLGIALVMLPRIFAGGGSPDGNATVIGTERGPAGKQSDDYIRFRHDGIDARCEVLDDDDDARGLRAGELQPYWNVGGDPELAGCVRRTRRVAWSVVGACSWITVMFASIGVVGQVLHRRRRWLCTHGTATIGVVTSVGVRRWRTGTQLAIRYRYGAQGERAGKTVVAAARLTELDVARLRSGLPVYVAYHPERPRSSHLLGPAT